MPVFFGASLPRGPFRDEIAQLCEKYRVEYRVSADIGQITNFFHYVENCEKIRFKRIYNYSMDNFVSVNSGGHQRLTSGRTSEKSNGTDEFGAQSLLQNIGDESNVSINYSVVDSEPPALNAADILMGTAHSEGISIMFSSGILGDAMVKEEERETSPLFRQNVPPPLQPIYPLFTDGCDAQIKEEVENDGRQDSGAVEGLVKEEPLGEMFDNSLDVGMHGGAKKSGKTRQDLPLALQDVVRPDNCSFFVCDMCNHLFKQQHSLLRHSTEAHPKCEECELRCPTPQLLTEHRRHFHGKNSAAFDCDICGRSLSSKTSLECHKMVHTGERPFECEVCLERFYQKGNLKAHMRTHTGEKPYKCEVCLGRFAQKGTLKIHMRIHTGEKPYECGVCQKRFNYNSKLARHRIIHTGQKPFECPDCLRSFADNSVLRRHRRSIHGF